MASGVQGKVDVSSANTWTQIVAATAGVKVVTLNTVSYTHLTLPTINWV